MDLNDLINWFEKQGIEVKRKWGLEEKSFNMFNFRIGRYYEGIYRGLRFTCSRTYTHRGVISGFTIRLYYSQLSQLALNCTLNISVFSPITRRYKDILAKKFYSGIKGLKCRAVKKDIAEKLFERTEVVRSIKTLKHLLNVPEENGIIAKLMGNSSALWIDDKGVGVFIPTGNNSVNFQNIMDAMLDFCRAVDDFARLHGHSYNRSGTLQTVFTGIVIAVTILALLLAIWSITSAP